MLWLPSNHVQSVTRVTILGHDVTAYEWNKHGLLRVPYSPDVLQAIVVEYIAGYDETPPDLKDLVRQHVLVSLTKSVGVTQETAGNVSISYAQGFATAAGGAQLTKAECDALAGYRLVEAM
jgi:hypothetical protein